MKEEATSGDTTTRTTSMPLRNIGDDHHPSSSSSSSVRFKNTGTAAAVRDNMDDKSDDQRMMQLFIGTANLGNAAPDTASWNAWIPADGYYCTTTTPATARSNDDDGETPHQPPSSVQGNTKYPLRRMIYNKNESGSSDNNTSSIKENIETNETHYCLDVIPSHNNNHKDGNNMVPPPQQLHQQYDLLIFGMQEATFDPPSSPSKSSSTVVVVVNDDDGTDIPNEQEEEEQQHQQQHEEINGTSTTTATVPSTTPGTTMNDENQGDNDDDDDVHHNSTGDPTTTPASNTNTGSNNTGGTRYIHSLGTAATRPVKVVGQTVSKLLISTTPATKAVVNTLSHTTTKAVHTTGTVVQKLHRTTEKTIHKVQTLSTSRDHCKSSSVILSSKQHPPPRSSTIRQIMSSSSLLRGGNRRGGGNNKKSNSLHQLDMDESEQISQQQQQHLQSERDGATIKTTIPTTTPTHTATNNNHHHQPTSTLSSAWLGGTTLLQQMYQQRLPSYRPIVDFQRGEMRLIIYLHNKHDKDDVNIVHVTAQNTGRAGLANKGGIVTELIWYHHTRISFVTAHLEAHEGSAKYMTRIQSIGDILNGTTKYTAAASTTTSAEENADDTSPAPTSSLCCLHDCSITSHYSFIMGDLNFRTELSDDQKIKYNVSDDNQVKQLIRTMINDKQYDAINDMDELHLALQKKDCLVGYETLVCNFPPTFKVERQDGYQYIDKRRPSYTDRILYKSNLDDYHHRGSGGRRNSNSNNIQPLLYEPIDSFTSSDHKPIRAAFAIRLNEPYMLRPKLTKRRSTLKLINLIHAKKNKKDYTSSLVLGQKERYHLFVTNMKCSIYDTNSNNRKNSSFSLVSSTIQDMYTGTPNPYVCLISDPSALLHHKVDRGLSLIWNNMMQRTTPFSSSNSNSNNHHKRKTHQKNHHTSFLNSNGYPRSSIQKQRFVAEWDRHEEIHTEIRTHNPDGSPIDLTGAMLRLTVMNHKSRSRGMIQKTTTAVTGVVSDSVIGTVTLHLVQLMRECRVTPLRNDSSATTQSFKVPAVTTKMMGGIEVQLSTSDDPTTAATTTKIVDNVHYSSNITTSTNTAGTAVNDDVDNDDDDDPIVRVDIDEAILKNGIETGRLQCQLEIWWTDGTISQAFSKGSSRSTIGGGAGKTRGRLVVGRRNNNRKSMVQGLSPKTNATTTRERNFERHHPLLVVPDRRTKMETTN